VNGLVPNKEWNFDRVTNPPAVSGDWLPKFEAIAGSGFAVDVTASDHPNLYLQTSEQDPVIDQDMPTKSIALNPLLGDRSISVTAQEDFTNPLYPDELCEVEYRFDTLVKVLTPGLESGPVAAP
jgi:hypothetical protein